MVEEVVMRIEKIWFDKERIYALFDDGRTMWQSLLYYRNLMNAKNRDDYVIEDDGVHWYGLDEDISNESFEYEDPEPRGLSRILLSHPELNLSAIARRMGLQQSLLAAYSNGNKHPSEAREARILAEIHKIGVELMSVGAVAVYGYGQDSSCGVLRDECVGYNKSDSIKSKMTLPELIRDALLRKGMTQKDLAGKIEVSPARVNAYVSGRATPTLKMAAKICRALSINPQDLLATQD